MSYGYMKKDVQRLRAEVAWLLAEAEQIDAEQDAELGSRRGDELPDELKRREQRLKAIEEAMQRLEEQERQKDEAKRRAREEAEAQRKAEGQKLRTESGKACYKKKKHIVEPVFGQIKQVRGFRQFWLRGLNNVRVNGTCCA